MRLLASAEYDTPGFGRSRIGQKGTSRDHHSRHGSGSKKYSLGFPLPNCGAGDGNPNWITSNVPLIVGPHLVRRNALEICSHNSRSCFPHFLCFGQWISAHNSLFLWWTRLSNEFGNVGKDTTYGLGKLRLLYCLGAALIL
jgi:hypothetical protein